ncbi:glycogen synthase GlgA [Microvirga sp. BT689]|uniref:glycogen synthase GlgA n=1 Tax=Microvirga arvi TaxID=2778731 RepID=UPI00194F9F8D|nr:glycogen synthase GlgA [Microvirga arvi]MBM6580435.1 glycogen synthase GlgA [Microvirga arvi]
MLDSLHLDAGSAVLPLAHAELQSGSHASISIKRRQSILFVTSEIADYIKAGGLGEVSAALPRALRHHYDVRILIPGYRQVLSQIEDVEEIARLPASFGIPACGLGRGTTKDGLTVYILLCPELYDRDGSPYVDSFGADWGDNDIRFARLGLAAADIACGYGDPLWRADLLHLNDWPSGLASAYLAWRGQRIPTILTIHNLAYQGNFDRGRLSHLGIPDAAFQVNGVEFYGKLSFLKAGIYYSSHITTVSSTYAKEITRPEFGCGLDGLLRTRAEEGRLDGIINGIDASWDPSTDPYLVSRFSAENCRGKRANANTVRRSFGLNLSSGPLFAVVSRLVHQKGVDLAISAAETIVSQGGQIAVIGQGEPRFEAALKSLANRHSGSVGVKIGYDEGDARRMYAGSDFLLMPSRFEPCGLSQMYAQRFGSLPIAHKTGGLADTIEDGVTGFLFGEPSLNRFMDAIRRGLDTFRSTSRLTAMRRAAMKRPHGWDRSASRYQEVYDRACQAALA